MYPVKFLYETGPNHDFLFSIVDTIGLVLYHQGISSYRTEYAPIRFQLFMG